MLIGIDGNEANGQEKVGIHQYSFEILWGLYKQNLKKDSPHYFTIFLKRDPSSDLPTENKWWKYRVLPGKGLWILKTLTPHLFFNKNIDVFFTPSHYLPFVFGLPKVCVIHDLGYLEFSGQFRKYDYWQLRIWSAISIYISKYIICPSEFTLQDIVRHYPFASDKTCFIHHGYDNNAFNTDIDDSFVRRTKAKYKIDADYFLFLSTLKPSKNVEGLLDAFSRVRRSKKVLLVIAGKKGWLYNDIFARVKSLRLEKDVIFTDYVLEDDKIGLFRGAKAFVLPSFWEGFGMDVVNSMACGTPVVISSVASLPEVAKDAGIYVDPYNIESISQGLLKVLTMPNTKLNKLKRAGLRIAKQYSWEKTAAKTLKVLEKVA